jgi:hypothetical protein
MVVVMVLVKQNLPLAHSCDIIPSRVKRRRDKLQHSPTPDFDGSDEVP